MSDLLNNRIMRFDNYLEGFDSLWDSEVSNAEFDEKRERERSGRCDETLWSHIAKIATTVPMMARTSVGDRSIHITRMGHDWLEGHCCGSPDRILAASSLIVAFMTEHTCTCDVTTIHVYSHVMFGAVLRQMERRSSWITALSSHGALRGRVTAVWRDSLSLRGKHGETLIPFASVVVVTEAEPGCG